MAVQIDKSISYINPYNFIQLPSKCIRYSKDFLNKDKLTGYIECTLIAKTPIFIPDIKTAIVDETNNYRELNFFKYSDKDDLPVIPGSEIRGMLRNDFEVFTDSCMSTLNEKYDFISRVVSSKKPGVLVRENNNWILYKATRYTLHTSSHEEKINRLNGDTKEHVYLVSKENTITVGKEIYKTGDKVSFIGKSISSYNKRIQRPVNVKRALEITDNGNMEGILLIGEEGVNKTNDSRHDSIFVYNNTDIEIEKVSDTAVEKLKSVIKRYRDSKYNKNAKNKEWYANYNISNDEGSVVPVWYQIVGEGSEINLYLSPAQKGKEAYYATINQLAGDFIPCVDKNNLCSACSLFGFTNEKTNDAVSSKIRITDALYVKENDQSPFMDRMIIKELASPHISNAAFYALYSISHNELFDLNYDYISFKNSMELIKKGDIAIRGRKTYWHHKVDYNNIITNTKARNASIIPVKENTKFKFKIYFDDVNKDLLNKLISTVTLKYKDKDLCHKIGMGKPHGFGSCKIEINNIKIKQLSYIDDKIEYNLEDYNNNTTLEDIINIETTSMKEALRIYDFNYLYNNYLNKNSNIKVDYPKGIKNGDTNTMNWFVLNRESNGNSSKLLYLLPRIIDDELSLPTLKR